MNADTAQDLFDHALTLSRFSDQMVELDRHEEATEMHTKAMLCLLALIADEDIDMDQRIAVHRGTWLIASEAGDDQTRARLVLWMIRRSYEVVVQA